MACVWASDGTVRVNERDGREGEKRRGGGRSMCLLLYLT
jgi:hypothetical protein